jgi:hypothetical protein
MGRSSGGALRRGFHSRDHVGADAGRLREERAAGLRASGAAAVPLGVCALSLKRIEDAVASPSGRLYERAAVVQWLLDKKRELKARLREWEEQEQAAGLEALSAQRLAERAEVARALAANRALGATSTSASAAPADKAPAEDGANLAKLKAELQDERAKRRRLDDRSYADKEAELRHASPWLPAFAPQAPQRALERPDERPGSPISGAPLKLKDLAPVSLRRDPLQPDIVLCALSGKPMTHQRAVLIRPSQAVLLRAVYDEHRASFAGLCPISGQSFQDPGDVLELSTRDGLRHAAAAAATDASSFTVAPAAPAAPAAVPR